MFIICFVTFLCGILGQVWYLIVSFPDLCRLSYFLQPAKFTKNDFINTEQVCRYRRDLMFTTTNIRFVHPEIGHGMTRFQQPRFWDCQFTTQYDPILWKPRPSLENTIFAIFGDHMTVRDLWVKVTLLSTYLQTKWWLDRTYFDEKLIHRQGYPLFQCNSFSTIRAGALRIVVSCCGSIMYIWFDEWFSLWNGIRTAKDQASLC